MKFNRKKATEKERSEYQPRRLFRERLSRYEAALYPQDLNTVQNTFVNRRRWGRIFITHCTVRV